MTHPSHVIDDLATDRGTALRALVLASRLATDALSAHRDGADPRTVDDLLSRSVNIMDRAIAVLRTD